MEELRPGILDEYREFLISNRRWWLTCLIVMASLLAMLVLFGQSGVSPFTYTLY